MRLSSFVTSTQASKRTCRPRTRCTSTSGGQQSSAAKATPLQAVKPSQACTPLRTIQSPQMQPLAGAAARAGGWIEELAKSNAAGVAAAAADTAARSEPKRQEQQRKRIATAAQANTKCQRAALPGASGATRGGRGGGRRSGGGRGRGRVSVANQPIHDFHDDDASYPMEPLEEAD
eukprot:364737-Chlamydomonas_euryale.AAC.4